MASPSGHPSLRKPIHPSTVCLSANPPYQLPVRPSVHAHITLWGFEICNRVYGGQAPVGALIIFSATYRPEYALASQYCAPQKVSHPDSLTTKIPCISAIPLNTYI